MTSTMQRREVHNTDPARLSRGADRPGEAAEPSESSAVLPLTVEEVLERKGREVITVAPQRSVSAAVKTLVARSVGALLVVEDEQIVGIVTERDILRASSAHERLEDLNVEQVMTRDVIIGLESDTVDYVMDLMTERRIRHLPILSGPKLAGILSIGDVVKARDRHAEVVIRYLKDYIDGQYPG